MSGSLSHGASAEPNLTPMLDMVFQLITFFMLVINFKSAQLDMSLKLPIFGSARPVETNGQDSLLVLNVNDSGELRVYGVSQPNIETYLANEAAASLLEARRKNLEIKQGDELPTTVVIRADKSVSFHLLNRVIKSCQDHGFRKFALRAMNQDEET